MGRKKLEDIRPIIGEIKNRLQDLYGEDLKDIIIYGSYARGEATKGSDIDIVVVLKEVKDIFEERDHILDCIYELNLKYDIVISIIPIEENRYKERESPFIKNIKKEGIHA